MRSRLCVLGVPDSMKLSDLPAGLPQAQLKNSLHMQHQNPEWEETATGSACIGKRQSESEGDASRAQQGQHCSQHNISSEAAAAGLGLASLGEADEVAQASGRELAGAPQAADCMDMDGSAGRAERLVAKISAVRDPQQARHLEARAQADNDSASGDCTASGWREVEARPPAAQTIPQACDMLAAPTNIGGLPGAPGICMSIAAEAVPSEAAADDAQLSTDGEATGACHSQHMSRALHSGSAADSKDGIPVSVSQCNMAQIPEDSISELADLAPIGWQREFEASLYGPVPGSAGQAGNREPAAGQLARPAQEAAQTQQESSTAQPKGHLAWNASAAGGPQLARALRRREGRGQGAVSAAGPANDTELEAGPAAGASQALAAAAQRRRGAPRQLAACPAEGPAGEHEPEAGAAAVPAAEASQASELGQQRQLQPSCIQATRQSKGQQPLISLYTWCLPTSVHSRRSAAALISS